MQEEEVGRLGTTGEDGPYIVPLSFVFHNNYLYFHCHHKGKKLRNIANDPWVCFQIDSGAQGLTRWKSVIIQGIAKQVTDDKEAKEAMLAMLKKYGSSEEAMVKNDTLSVMLKIFKITDYRLSSRVNEIKK